MEDLQPQQTESLKRSNDALIAVFNNDQLKIANEFEMLRLASTNDTLKLSEQIMTLRYEKEALMKEKDTLEQRLRDAGL